MSIKRKSIRKVPKYTFGGKVKDTLGDIGKGVLDSALTPFESIAGDFYEPEYKTQFGKEVIGKGNKARDNFSGQILPVAAGVVGTIYGGPMGGAAATAATKGLQQGVGGVVETPEEKRAAQAAIRAANPVDMTEVNNDPYNYFAQGGMTNMTTIEVEGKELETSNGKVLKDFKKQPSHKEGGYQYDAQPNRTIIPSNLRKRYLEGDRTTRTTIEANVVKDQVERGANELFGKGGMTHLAKYSKGGNTPKAKGGYSTWDVPQTESPYGNVPQFTMDPNQLQGMSVTSEQSPLNLVAGAGSGAGTASQFDWASSANTAMQLAPLAYNAVRGMQKTETLDHEKFQNPYESKVKSLMANRSIDMLPVENEIRDTYKLGLRSVGSGAKSSGQVLSGASALWASRMNALGKAKMDAQNYNNNYRGEEASTLGNLGAARARTKLGIQDTNMRSDAARRAFVGQTALEAQKYGNAEEYNDITSNSLEDIFKDYKYDRAKKRFIYKNQSKSK